MKKVFIGIDVSKETLDVALFERSHTSDWHHEKVSNNKSGFKRILQLARDLGKSFGLGLDSERFVFCCENTGIYSANLCEFLHQSGMFISQEHALSIKRSMGLQRGKTDKSDALAIAEYAMRFEDRLKRFEPPTPTQKQLRELLGYRAMLVQQRTALKVRISEKERIDATGGAQAFIRRSTLALIRDISAAIRDVEKRMEQLIAEDREMKEMFTILCSMPGIGPVNAITMLVRTQGFKKFNFNARQLACYYGIAPFAHESGSSIHGAPHVSKYADCDLKALLSQAALAAIRHNDIIKKYYQRCIERGKHPAIALNNAKNKMLHILVAMVKNRQFFDKRHECRKNTA